MLNQLRFVFIHDKIEVQLDESFVLVCKIKSFVLFGPNEKDNV